MSCRKDVLAVDNTLQHYGILGMKWGVRRYQNPDGTLTDAGKRRLEKKDTKWGKKNYDKITKTTKKAVKKELNAYGKEILSTPGARTSRGKISASAVNAYNKKMAELMTMAASDLRAPSGRGVKFIAKRGEIGVHMALASADYNMDEFKNGVWSSGRIAYTKRKANMA